ncbi:uncharacterized protein LOC117339970 [Pecten maximus]|uniref:uncharacterized protein LOC117339970 n=1 Tax=Pecten maximus TaxID=6579 RepID=UPI001458BD52|nr:uncharacterized protein LOC117339970 [Pecten maximus]
MAGVDYCTILPSWEFDKNPACVVSYQFDSIDGSLEANGTDYIPPNDFMDNCLTLECSSNDQLSSDSREPCTLSITSKPQYRVSILGIDIISQSRSLEVYDACEGYMTTSRGKRVPCLDAEGGENQSDVFACRVRLRETLFGFTVKFPSTSNMMRFNIYNIVLILNPEAEDMDNVEATSTFNMDKVKSFVDTDTMSPGAQQLMRSVEQFQQNKKSAVSGLQGMFSQSTSGSSGSSRPGMMELMGLMSMFSNMSTPSQSGSRGTSADTTQLSQLGSRGTDTTQRSQFGSRGTPKDATQLRQLGSRGTDTTQRSQLGSRGTDTTQPSQLGSRGTDTTQRSQFGSRGTPKDATQLRQFGPQGTATDTTRPTQPDSSSIPFATNQSDSRHNTQGLNNPDSNQQQMRNAVTNQMRETDTTVLQANPPETSTSSLNLSGLRNLVSGSGHPNSGGGSEDGEMYQMLQNICGGVSQMRNVHKDGNDRATGTGHEQGQLDNQQRFEGDTGEEEGQRSQSEASGGQKYSHDTLRTVVKSCMEEFELRLQNHIDTRLSQIERKLDVKLDRIMDVLQSLTRSSLPSQIPTDTHTSTLTHVNSKEVTHIPTEGATYLDTDDHTSTLTHVNSKEVTHIPTEGATYLDTDDHTKLLTHGPTGDELTVNNNTPSVNGREQYVEINTDIPEEENRYQPINSPIMDDESGENS